MGKFLTPLRVEEVSKGHWELMEPLIYKSKTIGLIIVDEKFLTDFGSVKRLPFIYWLFGGTGNKECVLHDKLYSKPHDTGTGRIIDRGIADKVLRGAIYQGLKRDIPEDAGFMLSLGVVVNNVAAYAKAWCMWVGVRIGGAGHWE